MSSIETIAGQLAKFDPCKAPDRHARRRSAVALLLRHDDVAGAEILMIERAQRDGDPWSGHMGFPGGRLDDIDAHSYDAALRETREELGVDISTECCLGRLSDLATHLRSGSSAMLVTPYVFVLSGGYRFEPNYEVADILWIPLSFLADPANRQYMDWHHGGMPVQLPCYSYREKRIWGLSLGMLDEFMSVTQIANFPSVRPPL